MSSSKKNFEPSANISSLSLTIFFLSLYFQDRLTDIQEDWEETVGKGFCHCQQCTNEDVSYPGECPELTSKCIKYVSTI